jgi:DNA repair exonuclease SbcCD ATPase subunit
MAKNEITKRKGAWADTSAKLTKAQNSHSELLAVMEEAQDTMDKFEFWKRGFGPKGVPSLFIELVLPNISAKIQKYADILTGGDIRVSLKAYAETQKQTVKEAIQISAVNTHGASVYGANSAGERNRINLAVTLGLIEYFRDLKVFSSSLLICDEVFDGLDSTGVEMALTALKEANIPSVLVISHHEHFKPLFSNVCYAVKEHGISEIRS